MLPRFWMAGRRLTSTPRRANACGPRLKLIGHDRGQKLGRQADGERDREQE